MAKESMAKVIGEYSQVAEKMRKDCDMSESMVELVSDMAKMLKFEIHEYLNSLSTPEAEAKIRDYVKFSHSVLLPLIEAKILHNKNRIDKIGNMKYGLAQIPDDMQEEMKRCMDIRDDIYALIAFRSLKHLALFMEEDKPLDEQDWHNAGTLFDGLWFHANRMILDGTVQFLMKQMPTGFGKCLLPDTNVYTDKGRRNLSDIKIGDKVYSMRDRELVLNNVTNIWKSKKPQIKIQTRGGLEIVISPEHRLYTQRGYVRADDLNSNDYLYRLCSKLDFGKKNEIPFEELVFISCMLFDGHCKRNCIRFTHKDGQLFELFLAVLKNLNITYSIKKEQNCKEVRVHSRGGVACGLLEKYGLLGLLSKEKHIPLQFYEMPISQKYIFIGIMFASDGYINIGKSLMGITSASEDIVKGLQSILNTCGIYSYRSYKISRIGKKGFPSYVLNIPNEYVKEIIKNCYCYDKQSIIESKVNYLKTEQSEQYSLHTGYPKEVLSEYKCVKRERRKNYYKVKSIKRSIIEDMSERYSELKEVIYKDFLWDKIKTIQEDSDIVDMIDIEVDGDHNFIANDIVSHNSYSDIVMISFILGVNIDDDIIKMFGNKTNITPCMNSLVDYMTSRRYAKVFPYYEQFSCSEELMFETMKKSSGQLKIKGSKKPVNVLVASKETAITGARAKFLFIDDITQREDAGNMREHEKDITRFNDIWKKRNYYLDKFRITASGTSYSVNDILSYLRGVFGAGREGNKITHKYVEVAECDELKEGGESVFVKIPKLDYDTDEATHPVKSPTKQARLDRDKDPMTFAAMDQQNPLPPEGTPFAYNKLDTYDVIPHEDSDTCWACIDPARTGKNYVTMLIFKKVPIGNLYKHYLVDCVYEMRPMDDMYPFFIEKIINHRITKLHIERNTDTSLKRTILMMLQAKGVSFCEISEVYSTKKKEDKIYDMEAAILNNVKFPVQGMYSPNSQMGTAMRHITSYSYKVKVDYDDAPDCLAMYCEKYVMETRSLPKVQILDIRRRKY